MLWQAMPLANKPLVRKRRRNLFMSNLLCRDQDVCSILFNFIWDKAGNQILEVLHWSMWNRRCNTVAKFEREQSTGKCSIVFYNRWNKSSGQVLCQWCVGLALDTETDSGAYAPAGRKTIQSWNRMSGKQTGVQMTGRGWASFLPGIRLLRICLCAAIRMRVNGGIIKGSFILLIHLLLCAVLKLIACWNKHALYDLVSLAWLQGTNVLAHGNRPTEMLCLCTLALSL